MPGPQFQIQTQISTVTCFLNLIVLIERLIRIGIELSFGKCTRKFIKVIRIKTVQIGGKRPEIDTGAKSGSPGKRIRTVPRGSLIDTCSGNRNAPLLIFP